MMWRWIWEDEVQSDTADIGRHGGMKTHLHGPFLDLLAELEGNLSLAFDLALMRKDLLRHELANSLNEHLCSSLGVNSNGIERFPEGAINGRGGYQGRAAAAKSPLVSDFPAGSLL
jgi:hypothetical protein